MVSRPALRLPSPSRSWSLARALSCATPLLAALAACHADPQSAAPPAGSTSTAPATTAAATSSAVPVVAVAARHRPFAPSKTGCDAVDVYTDGHADGAICSEDADQEGLTVVDLSDTWTPRVFAPDAQTGEAPEYREKYLELAHEPNADLGLYGVAPTLSVLFARLDDERRVACDADVDLAPLASAEISWSNAPDKRTAAAVLKAAGKGAALEAAQRELACARLFKSAAASGVLTNATHAALDAFRRRHMIVGAGLDGDTLHALALGGDELAFVGVLRGLRERVADAAGLVEDGTALGVKAEVVGRDVDLSRFAPAPDPTRDVDGATDLVDEATDAAARALGWTGPEEARAFFAARGKRGVRELSVAVKLPPKPAYYSDAMSLRVEIDRGDVFYETPGQAALERKKLAAFHGPSFVVYADVGDKSVALMRWATTIGGWKKEREDDGTFSFKYKESDVGDRVWRQVIAAPAWMPPDSTPETDLLHEGKDGTFALKRALIQPGYGNAYGLVMLPHEEVVVHGNKTTYADHGIRTHGSVDYASIQRGESHGCHRLYNQLALRLSGFLLEHHAYTTRGKMAAGYHRSLSWSGQVVDVDVPTRGYSYELVPPIPVRVLTGHIAGAAQRSLTSAIPIKSSEPKKG
jgi:hypothetical protein